MAGEVEACVSATCFLLSRGSVLTSAYLKRPLIFFGESVSHLDVGC